MRQTLIAGNWKMNGTRESVDHLLQSLKARASEVTQAELAIFPPYIFLEKTAQILKSTPIRWGAQNVSQKHNGAFTGEISANMLIDFDCRYVIVGHSERRTHYHEDNACVAEKFMMALSAGLQPILCIGESLEQRLANKTFTIISEQLDAILSQSIKPENLVNAVIAYEPIWAIGTGEHASPEEVQRVHEAIRKQCRKIDLNLGDKIRILYGGSVNPNNAADLLSMPDIDGVLVGGASLDPDKFVEIALCKN